MLFNSSGSIIADKIGQLNISGNVTPAIWYKKITRDNGKPYLLAIAILSDIVYWYRPREVRDEYTGELIGWKKKFKADLLCKTYQNYADFFGESKRSVKAAMDRLEELNLIKRVFRDEIHDGQKFINVMYIALDPDMIYSITFTDYGYTEAETQHVDESINDELQDNFDSDNQSVQSVSGNEIYAESYENADVSEISDKRRQAGKVPEKAQQDDRTYPPTKFCTTPLQNFVPPSHKILYDPPTKFCNFTKNTTEITTENINQSIYHDSNADDGLIENASASASVKKIKENLEYNLRMQGNESGMTDEQKTLSEIFAVICDVINAKDQSYTINGTLHTYEDVCYRFMQLDYEHAMYAAHQVINSTTEIKNMRSYIIAALYNSACTMQLSIKKDIHNRFGY